MDKFLLRLSIPSLHPITPQGRAVTWINFFKGTQIFLRCHVNDHSISFRTHTKFCFSMQLLLYDTLSTSLPFLLQQTKNMYLSFSLSQCTQKWLRTTLNWTCIGRYFSWDSIEHAVADIFTSIQVACIAAHTTVSLKLSCDFIAPACLPTAAAVFLQPCACVSMYSLGS